MGRRQIIFGTWIATCATLTAAQTERTEPPRETPAGLRLFLAAGARETGDRTLERLRQVMPRLLAELESNPLAPTPRVRQLLLDFDWKTLPVDLRLYVPHSWPHSWGSQPASGGRDREPPCWVAVVDAARKIAIEEWIGRVPDATPGGAAADQLFVREHEVPWGHRYLIGKGADALGGALESLATGTLPALPARHSAFFDKVRGHAMWAFGDSSSFSAADAGKLRAIGGPMSTLFGVTLSRHDGDWNVDVHWGGQPGSGILGTMLPRTSQTSHLFELLPWKPGVAIQATLGDTFASKLARFDLPARMTREPAGQQLVAAVLEAWRGEIGFFQPEPDADYDAPSLVPPVMTVSREFVYLVRIDRTSAGAVLAKLKEAIRAGRVELDEATGTYRLDNQRGSCLHFGAHDDLLAICGAPAPETCARTLAHILEAARRAPVRPCAKMDSELAGPVQAWLTPRAGSLLARRFAGAGSTARREVRDLATASGIDLLLRILRRGAGASLSWDATGVRLRWRF